MTAKARLMIVEDDPDIRTLLRRTLEGYGYTVSLCGTGRDARAALRKETPDLCIIDLGLPDMDGLTLVRELCEDPRTGVMVLTGRGDVTDRVVGLELGADDYIVKPFEPRELVARVNRLLRRREQLLARTSGEEGQTVRFAGWTFTPGNLTLTAEDGHQETLSAAEAALLLTFLKAPRRVLSREFLQGSDFDRDDIAFDRSIDVRISRIRKKIEPDSRSPQLIKTVYGAGYLFSADVEWLRGG